MYSMLDLCEMNKGRVAACHQILNLRSGRDLHRIQTLWQRRKMQILFLRREITASWNCLLYFMWNNRYLSVLQHVPCPEGEGGEVWTERARDTRKRWWRIDRQRRGPRWGGATMAPVLYWCLNVPARVRPRFCFGSENLKQSENFVSLGNEKKTWFRLFRIEAKSKNLFIYKCTSVSMYRLKYIYQGIRTNPTLIGKECKNKMYLESQICVSMQDCISLTINRYCICLYWRIYVCMWLEYTVCIGV